jgi:hypothetical protein
MGKDLRSQQNNAHTAVGIVAGWGGSGVLGVGYHCCRAGLRPIGPI